MAEHGFKNLMATALNLNSVTPLKWLILMTLLSWAYDPLITGMITEAVSPNELGRFQEVSPLRPA